MERDAVRVRFAPSPTGMLHLGGARTALFNYLFARHAGGEVVLRIEDTDRARSTQEFERAQLEDLDWLGLGFDEGPYRQSERGPLYEEAAERLSRAGLTYEAEDEAGRRALYFRPPERSGSFRDGLRGEVRFSGVEDIVIRKSDGTPAYNFAAVVDDRGMGITHVIRGEEHPTNTARQALLYRALGAGEARFVHLGLILGPDGQKLPQPHGAASVAEDREMGITNVIRGEEHLTNTARQALLYRALGAGEPRFVHLGLILGPDGKKLSKRHGAASVAEYRKRGYLPEAVVSYLALLGWSHPEGKEQFDGLDDLVGEWDLSRLGASPAAFDQIGRASCRER